jgi:hypothetical protein
VFKSLATAQLNVIIFQKKKGELKMTRSEHMQWCKDRALEYIHNEGITNGISSMMSDLRKHPETENHAGIQLGLMMLMGGHLNTTHEAEKFINGFN